MEHEVLAYLRLVMYPLAALGLSLIAIIRWQDGTERKWIYLMIAGIFLIMSLFIMELLVMIDLNYHAFFEAYFLTPAITILAIGTWIYVFSIMRKQKNKCCGKELKTDRIA